MMSFYYILKKFVKILLIFISTEFFVQFIPPLVIALKCKNCLNYKIKTEQGFSYVFPLFDSFSSLCIIANDEDLLNTLIDNFRFRDKFIGLSLTEFEKVSLLKCESVILLNLVRCSDFKNINVEKYQFSIYLFNYLSLVDLKELESCFYKSISPEIVAFSLYDFSIHELSPMFSSPRCFTRSSVNQVLNHRERRIKGDLNGIQITGAFIRYPPFTIQGADKPDDFDGIEVLLFRQLSRQLNFTPRYLIFDNWGHVGNDGVWTSGVGQAMQMGKAHVAFAAIWEFSFLYKIMDFGPSITKVKLGFLVRRPEQMDFDWRSLISVFNIYVWLTVLLSFTMTVAVYWYGINRGLPCDQRDWTGCMMVVFGRFTISTSYSYCRDRNYLSRFVLISWSLFSLLLTTLLSTGIFCSLTLPLYSARVDTVRQLVEGSYYWTAQYYARLNNDDLRQSMFNFKNRWHCLFEKQYRFLEKSEVETRTYYDEKITFLVQTYGNDLVILDTEGLHGHITLQKFRMVKETTSEAHITYGVEKNSPLLEPLSKMTLMFLQVGLLEQWKVSVIRRWKIHDTRHILVENDDPSFSEPDLLRINKLQPVFYMLLIGLSISFLIFILELVWWSA